MDETTRDKYPPPSGRRQFVKGMVGAGTASTAATAGAAGLHVTTNQSGVDSGQTDFVGIANVDGPAPRGMPIVPLTVEDGALKGRFPEVRDPADPTKNFETVAEEVGGVTYSVRWFQYFVIEQAPGLDPTADQDGFLRNAGGYDWQSDLDDGAKLRLEHFADYEEWGNGVGQAGLGKPAKARWRSRGENVKEITVMVLRTPKVGEMVAGEGQYADLDASLQSFLETATTDDCVAWLDKCTHYCCVPKFKDRNSAKFDAENKVYCACHQSVYDPFQPVEGRFFARPRPR